ncbi:MAG: NmrA/HSCARG family protein [Thermoleophilia bacterium]
MSSNSEKIILVTGITGRQGGAVARRLHADGWRVRGLTRDPDAERARPARELGVELATGDLTDERSLVEPLSGVYGIFAMATPFEKGIENEIAQGNTLGNVATAMDVGHYVYSSVGSANKKTGIPHFESKAVIEEHLGHLDLPLTIIRPVYFMENLVTWGTQRTPEGLVVQVPLSSTTRLQMIAVDDVGAIVALAFAQPDTYIGSALDIAGDELTIPEAAAVVSAAIGEPVRYVQVPWNAVRAQNEDFHAMYDWFEHKGYSADIEDVRKRHPELLDLRAWAARGGARPLVERRAA